ncbi:MAG: hypothetical protein ACI4WW_03325 [Candidatus Coprovivens sp.]
MSVSIKFNETKFDTLISDCETAINDAGSILTKFENLKDMKISLSDERVKKTYINDEGNNYDYTEYAIIYNNSLDNASSSEGDRPYVRIKSFKSSMENYVEVLKNIRTAIQNFDGNIPSLKEALESVDGYNASDWKYETVDGVEVAKYKFVDQYGNVSYMTVAEMTNAGYTAINMTMSEVVVQGLSGSGLDINGINTNVNAFISAGAKSRAFSVASKQDINNVLTANNTSLSAYSALQNSILSTNPNLLNQVNAVTAAGFSAAGLLLAGMDLRGGFVGQTPSKPSKPINNGGSTNQHSDIVETPSKTEVNEEIVNPPEEIVNPPEEVVDPPEEITNDVEITDIIPESEIPEEIDAGISIIEEEIDYDELARQQYEDTDLEELNEYRQSIIDDVNSMLENGEIDKIKEKLKEYGYSDEDIDKIVADREACINAVLAGDEKQQLSKIAKELAEKDGIKDYESVYEQTPTYLETVDGTDATLLVIYKDDERITAAEESLVTCEDKYKDAVIASNEAVAAVTVASTQMKAVKDEYVAKYGTEDTTKWGEDAAKRYNDSIERYNSTVQTAKEKASQVEAAKNEVISANDELKATKDKVREEIKENNRRVDILGEVDKNGGTTETLDETFSSEDVDTSNDVSTSSSNESSTVIIDDNSGVDMLTEMVEDSGNEVLTDDSSQQNVEVLEDNSNIDAPENINETSYDTETSNDNLDDGVGTISSDGSVSASDNDVLSMLE